MRCEKKLKWERRRNRLGTSILDTCILIHHFVMSASLILLIALIKLLYLVLVP